ncbi:putative methyltransferase [Sulfurimicrobium lacus]|uniref:Putative methyltransferase n=1 Tax=Sulfurimicrobium lacus TaxID=2715678 RepID=A0A6F8VA94_9PROT|nr:class I SAM-dependent methyltransferase [Sulfurimicrobium lacus]BCB26584.1 putative methyltransferase [Sulfurimicrobium lacus]
MNEQFDYLECGNCGCLQIAQIPDDLSRFYPDNYYSFSGSLNSRFTLASFAKKRRFAYCIEGRDLIGKALTIKFGKPEFASWFTNTQTRFADRILDVGCGSGRLLLSLRDMGFIHLEGIDPYIAHDINYDNGVKILKAHLHSLESQYDFIMLHHSFEHMEDPQEVMKQLFRITRPGHYVLIRVPVASSYAWRTYRENWVQLDAPRHLYLHTEKSMKLLAEHAGFHLDQVVHDSSPMQFWGSEQYRMNITLRDPKSYMQNPQESPFTQQQISEFQQQSEELNRKGEGDQACFYFRKPDTLAS